MPRTIALAIDLIIVALICLSLFSAGSILSDGKSTVEATAPATAPELAAIKTAH